MKQPPNEDRQTFRPSKFSGEGFLGSDGRTVDEIITTDARALEEAGLDHEVLADALEAAYLKTRGALGAAVELAAGVRGEFHESMGRIPCPFKGCGVFEKGEAVITDTASNASLNVTVLGIHLIRKHGFFQGRGSRFRIEPLEAARMLRGQGRLAAGGT